MAKDYYRPEGDPQIVSLDAWRSRGGEADKRDDVHPDLVVDEAAQKRDSVHPDLAMYITLDILIHAREDMKLAEFAKQLKIVPQLRRAFQRIAAILPES
jgi:hypothetical protein